ncbi:MAG: 6-carboxytetrahydropterin synthase [candidate division KSB1 bacterium]|nr:6-carboxytetrahydropterin synthase [candidate division KSB1 bacterium]
MKVYLTKQMHFNAAHRLHSEQLSDSENQETYGVCNNPMGHGHNYDLEITVVGSPDPVTGMVMDLKELKDIVHEHVISKVDHKHLNFDVPFMRNVVPTAENMAVAFWNQLIGKFPGADLYEIKLYETPRNIVVYRGEQE